MVKIHIDGRDYEVEAGKNLLHTCLSLGFDLPYFCWHPALHSVGACRQCAVKQFRDAADTRGRIVMACMTEVTDGMRISVSDAEARAFRKSVVEWLMTNHPHDCPVCDEGGECHLQDMTVMTGHAYRSHRFAKRTHRNQDLGPLVNHEMNRCIACYRCVRFYRDYAGGRDLDVMGAHHNVYFGRAADGVLESEFGGNLVEICPTGVFTDKTLKRHYSRKWDLAVAPSVCVHCAVGCNTIPGERYGTLRRVRNRFNREVNGWFLCDRGRYGYEFVNHEKRIREACVRQGGQGSPERETRLALEAALRDRARVIGIGSPRASLESNFALRALVGPERFFQGVSEADGRLAALALRILRDTPAHVASAHDVEQSDAVLVLGEDVTQTAPILALALHQAVRNRPKHDAAKCGIPPWNDAALRELAQDAHGPLYVASPTATRLDDVAARTLRAAPDGVAWLGQAVARRIDPRAPGTPEDGLALADEIADALLAAERPLVLAGTGCASDAVLRAAANVARALCRAGRPAEICLALPECNSLGLAMLGGGSLAEAFGAVERGEADTVVVLENDLYRRASAAAVDAFLARARHVVVLDHLTTATTEKAKIVLPAATFAESQGTLVNHEGRAQRFYRVIEPATASSAADRVRPKFADTGVAANASATEEDNGGGSPRASWRHLIEMARGARSDGAWDDFDALVQAIAREVPELAAIADAAPPAGFRVRGQKAPRQPHRYSGRTAMRANASVSEPRPPDDPDSPLAYSMEGANGQLPAALAAHYWAPGWNSVQALHKFQQEVDGEWRGGGAGRRLIEPCHRPTQGPAPQETANEAVVGAYYTEMPERFAPREAEWLLVPLHHIFGSEELSVLAPGIAQLAPGPYVALNAEDAARAGVAERDVAEVRFAAADEPVRLPVRIVESLPHGVAGWPVGLPGMPWAALPAWVRIGGAR